MIRTFIAVLALGLALAAPALANPVTQDPAKVPAGTYELDKRHASLFAKIPHMGGFSRYALRMGGLRGGFIYDPANWQTTKVTITVDPAAVDTGEASFDNEVAGYLGAGKFPIITFASTDLKTDGAHGVLTGDLTFHGVTKPVALDVTFNGVGPGLLGAGTRIGFSGTGHIKRSDFGATGASIFAGDDVDLVFEVEFVKK